MRVAFLPGAAGHGSFWDPVRERLTDDAGVEATSFDWPGFGGNAPDPRVRSYDDLASLVIERLERFGPSVVAAQSMGGVVAMMVVERRPDLVTHLVLAATSAGVDMAPHGAADWRPGSRAAHPTNPPWMWEPVRDLTPALRAVTVKTLLVWATDDPISPIGVGAHLASLIPRARLSTFSSADHWVAHAEAEAVARRIVRLVQPRVGFLHTAAAHVATFDALVGEGAAVMHAVDAELLDRARTHGTDDPMLAATTAAHLRALGRRCDVVVCTCSTVGGLAETLGTPGVEVLRVDRPMAAAAVATGRRIVVVAALESTVEPTVQLLEDEARRQGLRVEVDVRPCFEAWVHWEAGDREQYLRSVAAHVGSATGAGETIVLAEASMAGVVEIVGDVDGRMVLSSPQSAVNAALASAHRNDVPGSP